jgi:hypothetical protein
LAGASRECRCDPYRSPIAPTLIPAPPRYLKVYDAPDDNDESALLWGCDGCDAVVPPPLVSTGGALFVSLLSDSNPAYYTVGTSNYDWRGFRAAFYADADGSIGMGDQTVRLGATAALAIEPPHASDGRYPASLDAYTWHISPWYAASSITLALSWVGLADCDDTLSVYDGPSAAAPLLGTFCGGILPSQRWLQSSGTHITAVLATDSDDDRDAGFNLGYFSEGEQYRCGCVKVTVPLVLVLVVLVLVLMLVLVLLPVVVLRPLSCYCCGYGSSRYS